MQQQDMIPSHRFRFSPVLLAVLCLSSLFLVSAPAPAQITRSSPRPQSAPQRVSRSVTFQPPRGNAPRETRGAASRGEDACLQAASTGPKSFTLLLPTSTGIGLTLAERPTFFAYVPPTSAQEAFFALKDESGIVQYQTRFALPAGGGVIPIALPESAPALEIGKNYEWGIVLLCGGRLRPDSPFASSWVKRTAPTIALANDLQPAATLEQAALYGENGLWYDTIATLATLRKQDPTNAELATTWSKLLDSVGLGAIAEEPLVE